MVREGREGREGLKEVYKKNKKNKNKKKYVYKNIMMSLPTTRYDHGTHLLHVGRSIPGLRGAPQGCDRGHFPEDLPQVEHGV